MSEKKDVKKEQSGQERPDLYETYRPAKFDTMLTIRFSGNTAQPVSLEGKALDPFQILAAAEWMKMKAFQMLQNEELKAARELAKKESINKIEVPGQHLPPGGFVDPLKGK